MLQDPGVKDREEIGDALTLSVLQRLRESGSFSSVESLPGKPDPADIVISIRVARYKQVSVPVLLVPSLALMGFYVGGLVGTSPELFKIGTYGIMGLLLYELFGGPTGFNRGTYEATWEAQDGARQPIGSGQQRLDDWHAVNMYRVNKARTVEAERTRFVDDILRSVSASVESRRGR